MTQLWRTLFRALVEEGYLLVVGATLRLGPGRAEG
jgi:hypothetical protein